MELAWSRDNAACSLNPITTGKHQLRNASAALACVESLSEEFPISQGSMRKALISVHYRPFASSRGSAHNSS